MKRCLSILFVLTIILALPPTVLASDGPVTLVDIASPSPPAPPEGVTIEGDAEWSFGGSMLSLQPGTVTLSGKAEQPLNIRLVEGSYHITFDNFQYEAAGVIHALGLDAGSVQLTLVGENIIDLPYGEGKSTAVNSYNKVDFHIKGDGSLKVGGTFNLKDKSSLTVADATLQCAGIEADGVLHFTGKANVTVQADRETPAIFGGNMLSITLEREGKLSVINANGPAAASFEQISLGAENKPPEGYAIKKQGNFYQFMNGDEPAKQLEIAYQQPSSSAIIIGSVVAGVLVIGAFIILLRRRKAVGA